MKRQTDRLLALVGSCCVHGIAVAAIVAYGSGDAKDAPPSPIVIAMAMEWAATPSADGTTSDAAMLNTESASQADGAPLESTQSEPTIKVATTAESPAPAIELARAPQELRPSPPKATVSVKAKLTPSQPAKEIIQTDAQMATISDIASLATQNDSASGNGMSAAPSPGHGADQPRSWSITSRIAPTYPMTARRQGSEGEVALRVDVDRDGKPRVVTITRSSGDQQLDGAAKRAVEQWRFAVAAPMTIEVPIQFRLKSDTLADTLAANHP